MGLLSSLYQQQQQINQNPTSTIRTPIQNAYDNLLNAQANAQNTAKEEWGSAIGNSVNGLAKIIASSVIGNPIEKAASTRNLDNFDARQDALVRQWAMEQAKKRNDFVNQAREQLGMAKADEEQAYNRDLTAQNISYQKELDRIKQANIDREFENMLAQQQEKSNQQKIDNDYRKEYFEWLKSQAKENANTKSQEQNYKQVQETLANIENINGKLNKLQQAKDLNNTTSQKSDFGTILKASWNPFAAAPSENRLSPIYQAFTTENDPKKAEMELEKLGLNKNMSREDYNRNIDRLINDNRNEIIKEYAKLGYKILQDDETGAIRVVDNNGNTIQEF